MHIRNGLEVDGYAHVDRMHIGNGLEQEEYDNFIRGALAAGFLDDQVDFLWDWFEYFRNKRHE